MQKMLPNIPFGFPTSIPYRHVVRPSTLRWDQIISLLRFLLMLQVIVTFFSIPQMNSRRNVAMVFSVVGTTIYGSVRKLLQSEEKSIICKNDSN